MPYKDVISGLYRKTLTLVWEMSLFSSCETYGLNWGGLYLLLLPLIIPVSILTLAVSVLSTRRGPNDIIIDIDLIADCKRTEWANLSVVHEGRWLKEKREGVSDQVSDTRAACEYIFINGDSRDMRYSSVSFQALNRPLVLCLHASIS